MRDNSRALIASPQGTATLKTAFLLGAGASIHAGMPSTQEITDRVLSGAGFMRHTDGNYVFEFPGQLIPDEHLPKVLAYIQRLHTEVCRYYHRPGQSRPINYEDIAYLAGQILDDLRGQFDNPALRPLIDEIWRDTRCYALKDGTDIVKESKPEGLYYEAVQYIECVVWRLLDKTPTCLDCLNCLAAACSDDKITGVDIFSLNHDRVVDHCLAKKGIQFVDGFGAASDDLRRWDENLFKTTNGKVRVFKLHGCIDYYYFPGERLGTGYYAVPTPGKDILQERGSPSFPRLLIGTFNKMLWYTSGIYADLYHQFFDRLRKAEYLVIVGYGFGDRGINNRIIEWLAADTTKKAIVVDPGEDLKRAAIGAGFYWDAWTQSGRLRVIKKAIHDTSWSELSRAET